MFYGEFPFGLMYFLYISLHRWMSVNWRFSYTNLYVYVCWSGVWTSPLAVEYIRMPKEADDESFCNKNGIMYDDLNNIGNKCSKIPPER